MLVNNDVSMNSRSQNGGNTCGAVRKIFYAFEFYDSRIAQSIANSDGIVFGDAYVLHEESLAGFFVESLDGVSARGDGIEAVVACIIRFCGVGGGEFA